MARPDQVTYYREEAERKLFFARAVKADNILYISGCTSVDDDGNLVAVGDMEGQIRQVYTTLGRILELHNASFEHVVKETMYVTDIAEFLKANFVRGEFYADVAPPASTGVEVSGLVHPDMLVEIELIAHLP